MATASHRRSRRINSDTRAPHTASTVFLRCAPPSTARPESSPTSAIRGHETLRAAEFDTPAELSGAPEAGCYPTRGPTYVSRLLSGFRLACPQ